MPKSVYIHIPFCNQICSYCDFPKFFYNKKWINKYLESLDNEIKTTYKNELVKTIYIGGGTPSSLDYNELKQLLEIISQIKKDKNIEYTIETNIDNLSTKKIRLLKEYGINRVSIGVQTLNPRLKTILERNSNLEELKHLIKNLKKENINNINVDLIYAVPSETLEELEKDIEQICSLDITHISTYSLIIEEHTKLYNQKTKEIDENLDLKMYNLIRKKLKENKFIQYETSNFAKKKYESKHNLNYWNNNTYYGFGLGASSYIGNKRITTSRNLIKYLNKEYIREIEELSKEDTMEYEMILGLRKIKGVNIKQFQNKYNTNIKDCFDISDLLKNKELKENKNNIYINPKYIYVSNEILIKFIK